MKVKIFSSNNKKVEIFEEKVNKWLSESNVEIINVLTTSNTVGIDETYEDVYLIFLYKENVE